METTQISGWTVEELQNEIKSKLKEYCTIKNEALNGRLFPKDGFVPGLDDGVWTPEQLHTIAHHLNLSDDTSACPHCVSLLADETDYVTPEVLHTSYCKECLYAQTYGSCLHIGASQKVILNPLGQYSKVMKHIQYKAPKEFSNRMFNLYVAKMSITGFLEEVVPWAWDRLDRLIFDLQTLAKELDCKLSNSQGDDCNE